jgi:hypothetical protein
MEWLIVVGVVGIVGLAAVLAWDWIGPGDWME